MVFLVSVPQALGLMDNLEASLGFLVSPKPDTEFKVSARRIKLFAARAKVRTVFLVSVLRASAYMAKEAGWLGSLKVMFKLPAATFEVSMSSPAMSVAQEMWF
jgi:hypothetical protein